MNSLAQRLNDLRKSQATSAPSFKPIFYRLQNPDDRVAFEKLLQQETPTVNDHLLEQVSEYVKLKHPHRKFSGEELQKAALTHIGDTPHEHYGAWVYYPWSNRVVHVLDEREFIEVRTSRNQYKITPEEREILALKKIGVIGLSVGQSVSVTLAMERICGELRLADFDKLELTNLNRIRTGVHNLGLEKVYSVAREISEIDPYINVICFPDGLTETNMDRFFTEGGKLDLLVEESDGFDIKILCRYKARELQVPVIMEASDRCMVDVERFDLEPNRSILHGIVDHLDIPTLKSLKTNEEKIPYMLDVLGIDTTTPRLKASMIEMQQTITTWPQLASAVTMGGGITADVSRRMLLNQFTQSGRYYVDIDELIGNNTKQETLVSDISTGKSQTELTLTTMKRLAEQAAVQGSELTGDHALKIVEAAIAAPSNANQQPWKWYFHQSQLFLFKDAGTEELFTDPQQLYTNLSLGASLENAAVMASELGYSISQDLYPAGKDSPLVAACSFRKNDEAADKAGLAAFLHKRHTNRKAGTGEAIPETVLQELGARVAGYDAVSLKFSTKPEEIERISQILGICERIRLLDPKGHHDYFNKELKWPVKGQLIRDGVDIKTLSVPTAVETALRVISHPSVAHLLNNWEKGIAFEKLQYSIASTSSAIGLLSVDRGSGHHDLAAGMALENLWLHATKLNLAFQPICLPLVFLKHLNVGGSGAVFSEKINTQLKAIQNQLSLIFSDLSTNNKEGVFLFRLSYAPSPEVRSMRKSLENVYFKS